MKDYKLGQTIEFLATLRSPTTGAASDADSTPTYAIYREGYATALVTGNCTKRATGFYAVYANLDTEGPYEVGKTYSVRVAATVAGIADGEIVGTFRILPTPIWDSLYGGTSSLGVSLNAGHGLALDSTVMKAADYTAPPTTSDIASAVWTAANRSLTSFGSLVSDVATAVWSAGSRTLTAFGSLVTDIWAGADKSGYSLAPGHGLMQATDYTAPDNAGISDIQSRLPAALIDGKMDAAAEVTVGEDAINTIASSVAAAVGSANGAGAIAYPISISLPDGTPVANAEVWITSDLDGADTGRVVAGTALTDANGQTTVYLDPGYHWIHWGKAGEVEYQAQRIEVANA